MVERTLYQEHGYEIFNPGLVILTSYITLGRFF